MIDKDENMINILLMLDIDNDGVVIKCQLRLHLFLKNENTFCVDCNEKS